MDVGDLHTGLAGASAPGDAVSPVRWWTPSATLTASSNLPPVSSANTDVMNQLCRVCGEPAAGFHFGAFTCEGCKSFFGRTYNNLGSISECKNGGICVINKKNRTACKACRLRKCLMVGMSKSGSRYGRRSNWFKIHCLLQEQSNQVQTRLKPPKLPYEKVFGSLDAANNNNNNNNNTNNNNNNNNNTNNNNTTNSCTVSGINNYHDRLPKRDNSSEVTRPQDLLRQTDSHVMRSQDILRPESSRFPIWRGPPFFHPALTHMQLLNTPFFPFQQRFMVPYVGQMNPQTQPVTSLLSSSSSSETVSPRSTPSPKPEDLIKSEVSVGGSCDKSIAFFRSLGPEQEAPIDLSMKSRRGSCSEPEIASSEDEKSSDSEEDDVKDTETGPPLDLTRKT